MEVRSFEAIVRALNGAGVKYLVVGGIAVNAHGFERFTKDVDLVISLQPENLIAGFNALLGSGYRPRVPITPEEFADQSLREKWRVEKQMLVLQFWSEEHRRTPIDVFVHEPFDFEQCHNAALLQEFAPGLAVPVVSLDTLLQMKTEAGRPSDLVDVEELLKIDRLRRSNQ